MLFIRSSFVFLSLCSWFFFYCGVHVCTILALLQHIYLTYLPAFISYNTCTQGGRESIFQSLSDPDKPALVCGIIASHLQLIYQLKKILNQSLVCDLVWDSKESVPFSFSRYGDLQFKVFSRSQFEEVTGLLRQLILYTVPKVQGIDENLEYLRLSMSAKLLTCSQLQVSIKYSIYYGSRTKCPVFQYEPPH